MSEFILLSLALFVADAILVGICLWIAVKSGRLTLEKRHD